MYLTINDYIARVEHIQYVGIHGVDVAVEHIVIAAQFCTVVAIHRAAEV